MKNAQINVTSSFIGNKKNIIDRISSCLDSAILTNNGEQLRQLEKELKDYLAIENISLFCNGTIALLTALKALNLKGEVITTPFTFPATIHVLEWLGLTPIFCDIDPETMCIDAQKIEPLITSKTSAILGVHVYGMPCDVKKIDVIANKHNLKVIYDAAHSFITQIDGKSIGVYGNISMFSFHATKLFNTIEGGALVYNDKKLNDKLHLLKNFGIRSQEIVEIPGINGKMNEIQAIVGLENLRELDVEIKKREKISDLYNRELSNIDGIKLLDFPKNVTPSLQYYPIRVDYDILNINRDQIFEELKKENIFSRKYFYPLCSNYECYHYLPSAKKELLPIANKISEEILCLPFYGTLKLSVVKSICKIIKNLCCQTL
ncbi:MAG: dTDP-4-amino-4,6-dideoxygalactose transaminase [Lentimonas sp.]|jgi:dTDP-4-amino-4,6-dideoxygalactose transaminase